MSNISSLAHQLAEKHLLEEKAAESFIKTFFNVVLDGINKDKTVKVRGLGTFKVTSVAPRESVDVGTGRRITIEGRDKITFTPDNAMRDFVNRPFAQFETVTVGDDVDFASIDSKFATDSTAAVKELLGSEAVSDNDRPADSAPAEMAQDAVSAKQAQPVRLEAAEPAASTASNDSEPNGTESAEEAQEKANNPEVLQLSDDELEELNEDRSPVERTESSSSEVESSPSETSEAEEEPSEVATASGEEEGTVVDDKPEDTVENADKSDVTSNNLTTMDNITPPTENQSEPMTPIQKQWQKILENQMNKQLELELEKSNKKVKTLTIMVTVISVLFVVSAVSCFFLWKGDEIFKTKVLADETLTVSPGVSKAATKAHPATKTSTTAGLKANKANAKNVKPQPAATTPAPATAKAAPADNQETAFTDYVDNVRIRTGAYRIVGIQNTVTVKSGQTLSSLSKRYLGPGMECYLEAVNGGRKEFKEGEKIRIPEIKLKRRSK